MSTTMIWTILTNTKTMILSVRRMMREERSHMKSLCIWLVRIWIERKSLRREVINTKTIRKRMEMSLNSQDRICPAMRDGNHIPTNMLNLTILSKLTTTQTKRSTLLPLEISPITFISMPTNTKTYKKMTLRSPIKFRNIPKSPKKPLSMLKTL